MHLLEFVNHSTVLRNPKSLDGEQYSVRVDYSWWSHDGYAVRDADGYIVALQDADDGCSVVKGLPRPPESHY